MKSICIRLFAFFISVAILTIVSVQRLIAQESFNYMPIKIGWHDAVYDNNLEAVHDDEKTGPKLTPWTTWDDAIDREMNINRKVTS